MKITWSTRTYHRCRFLCQDCRFTTVTWRDDGQITNNWDSSIGVTSSITEGGCGSCTRTTVDVCDYCGHTHRRTQRDLNYIRNEKITSDLARRKVFLTSEEWKHLLPNTNYVWIWRFLRLLMLHLLLYKVRTVHLISEVFAAVFAAVDKSTPAHIDWTRCMETGLILEFSGAAFSEGWNLWTKASMRQKLTWLVSSHD
jgi:hypothetical protein